MEEPRIESIEAFTVFGLRYRGKNENQEIPQIWRLLMPRFGEMSDMVRSQQAYGVMGNMDDDSGEFDYLAGYEFAGTGDIPEGMDTWDVPEQRYAVFSCTLPTLMEAFDHIYGTWLPSSDYQRGYGPEFELYDEKFNPQDEDSIMFLYIPIR
jgi:AraC family transcriptional regulator